MGRLGPGLKFAQNYPTYYLDPAGHETLVALSSAGVVYDSENFNVIALQRISETVEGAEYL
jgi:hypothetical protein